MIQIDPDKLPSPEQAKSVLDRHTERCGIFFDLDRVLDYQSNAIETSLPILKEWRRMAGNDYLEPTKDKAIVQTLQSRFGVADSAFIYTDKGAPSVSGSAITTYLSATDLTGMSADLSKIVDQDKVQKAAAHVKRLNADAKEFLRMTKELKDLTRAISGLKQYTLLPISRETTFDNHRMVIGKSSWHIQNTGRIGARDPSVLNIDKDMFDIVSYPKGWLFLRADSRQIEPRITYSAYVLDPMIKELIMVYGDAYYGLLHYVLAPQEEIDDFMSGKNRVIVPHEITQEMIDGRKALKVLGLAGNYGSTNLDHVSTKYAARYTERIVNNPFRKQWEEQVRKAVYGGATTCREYFGYEITPDPDRGKYAQGGNVWKNHLIRCFINNPIQGTAGRLMCASVVYADEAIRKMSKYDNTYIAYYKHDEGAFYVREEDTALYDVLADCTHYEYDGWITIPAEVESGIAKSKGRELVSRV